tara:strand:- start:23629 stop:23853 length:225 start_codon:yes stop_codon:yes gene_type:complete
MKITIDTKEDSHEDIQKVVEILQHFSKKSEPVDSTNMMNMFSEQEPEPQATEETPPDFTSFLNLKKDDKDIQFF